MNFDDLILEAVERGVIGMDVVHAIHELTAANPDGDPLALACAHGLIERDTLSQLESEEPLLPARFGPFELIEKIGAGGFGSVFRARDATGETIAVKIVGSREGSAIARLEREAAILRDLQHPNVVRVLDSGRVEDRHYYSMELLEGRSLRIALEGGPLAPRRAAHIVLGIARGIAAAHRQGIVHRDIKPDNVVLVPQPNGRERPVVVDFGIALPPRAERWTGRQLLGTPYYMSPQQCRGTESEGAPSSDIYAIGVTLYELLSGAPPFRDTALRHLLHIKNDLPVPPLSESVRGIPQELERICLRSLEIDAERRYARAEELARALELFLASRRRLWWPLALLGLLGLLLSALLAHFLC